MKIFRSAALAGAFALGVSLFAAGDILTELGISGEDAGQYAVDALVNGSVPVYQARNAMKAAAPAARAALVEQALEWAKVYLSSSEFRELYAKKREEAKPAAPEAHKPFEAEQKEKQAESAAQIAQMRKAIEQLPADQRKEAEKAIEQALASQKQMSADPQFQKATHDMYDATVADEKKQHDEATARWQDDWPADPRQLIAKRLRAFIDTSATVDFEAKVVSEGGRQQFVNPRYQQQSSDWKLCYRAGRPTVEKARAFAQAWLRELGH